MATKLGWTVADLATLPEPLDDTRYEIIDGELSVSSQPSSQHQFVCNRVARWLDEWSERTGSGIAIPAPGVIFSEYEAVAPDVVWASAARLPHVLGGDGKF